MSDIKKLNYYAGGRWMESTTNTYTNVFNPSTGDVLALAPACTEAEVNIAVAAAKEAYADWARVPVMRRVQVLYKLKGLLEKNYDELTLLCASEHGKNWSEAVGDIAKVVESVELACGTPSLMLGESLMNTSKGFDTVMYREPIGVFVGIAPFNFPGMIPMGWMAPLCIATGNTIVIKASHVTPLTSMRIAELWEEAGLPAGVLNVITSANDEAELFLKHPDVKGVSFVGSTRVGLHVYSVAADHGKRVQAQTEAKNHALVLEDAALERSARGIINAAFGCAGERCMALPVVVAQESIADRLVELLVQYASELRIGPAYEKDTQLGPVVSEAHRKSVTAWIEKGIGEGAKLILDGRDHVVVGYEDGFYLGPTVFDHVTPEMTIGESEIFGPVLCVKRVKDFEEGITLMNKSRFANGSVIYTQSGYYSREFAYRTHGGMVGINVGIPVPVSVFPFSGHKDSFFSDLHVLGKDGVRFFTEAKAVTTTWFDEEEKKNQNVDSWDGALGGGTGK
ncbi:MAG: CoA-acylating methylmalonate-semialdehyde dehydrogenase [Ignavibacteriales bacterium]